MRVQAFWQGDLETPPKSLHTECAIDSGDDGAYCVITAGMEEGVVWGTIRAHVKEACHQLGMSFVEAAPCMADRGNWREAFISNR
jgi:hypothetical protein